MIQSLRQKHRNQRYDAHRGVLTVDENRVDPFLLESLDSLATRVVEFASLTDTEASTSKDENLFYHHPRIESFVLISISARELDRLKQRFNRGDAILYSTKKDVEKELCVFWSWSGLWVKLYAEEGAVLMSDTFIAPIVCIYEQSV